MRVPVCREVVALSGEESSCLSVALSGEEGRGGALTTCASTLVDDGGGDDGRLSCSSILSYMYLYYDSITLLTRRCGTSKF